MKLLPLLLLGCPQSAKDPTVDTDVDTVDTEASAFPTTFVLAGDTLYPESGVYDPVRRRFIVGSLTQGVLTTMEADTRTQGVFYADPRPEDWAVRGLAVDLTRRRLWSCAELKAGELQSRHIWWHNLDEGTLAQRFDLSTHAADAWCHDLVVATSGTVYVTDHVNGRIYKIEPTTSSITTLSNAGALDGGTVGASGIALTADGEGLIVSRYSRPALVHISLASPENAREIVLTGDDDGLGAGEGYAGLLMKDGGLYVSAVRSVLRVSPADAGWSSGTVTRIEMGGSGYTAVTEVDDWVYAVESDPLAWTLGIQPDLPFKIQRVPTP
jgi:sugar lactone lactonase YvrE